MERCKINDFQDPEAGLKMMYPLFTICALLETLHAVTGLIGTSNYKILIDQKGGNVTHWDAKCKGEQNSKMLQ